MTTNLTIFGFGDGDRVRHRQWGCTGTVRVIPNDPDAGATAEVRWDGSIVADEIDIVVDDLDSDVTARGSSTTVYVAGDVSGNLRM